MHWDGTVTLGNLLVSLVMIAAGALVLFTSRRGER